MDSLYKILDVLVDTLGPTTIKEHCDKKIDETQVKNKVIIKKIIIKQSQSSKEKEQTNDIDSMTAQMRNITISEPGEKINQNPIKPKKEVRRCEARIYGQKLAIPGTVSPTGEPYSCYKPAQCAFKASQFIEDEDGGRLYLCTVCTKRYNARTLYPIDWHGFFDDDGAPETSHFINSTWYKQKLAEVQQNDCMDED